MRKLEVEEGSEYVAALLSQEQVVCYWPRISKFMDMVPHIWNRFWTQEALLDAIIRGMVQAWGIGTKDQVFLFACTQIGNYATGKKLLGLFIFGNHLREGLPVLAATLERFAIMQGCNEFVFTGRDGWTRILAKYGMEPIGVEFRRVVTPERLH